MSEAAREPASSAQVQLALDAPAAAAAPGATEPKISTFRDGLRRPAGWVSIGTRMPFRVLRRAKEITPEWLTKVFQHRGLLEPWAKIATCEIKPMGEGLGVMGDIVFVNVKCENGGAKVPARFIAKFSPQENAPLPSFVIRAIFSTEAHWYNDFLEDDGGLPRPEAFLCAAKLWHQVWWWRRMPVFVMLLEELPPPAYSRVSGCDNLAHLLRTMEALAGLHARWCAPECHS